MLLTATLEPSLGRRALKLGPRGAWPVSPAAAIIENLSGGERNREICEAACNKWTRLACRGGGQHVGQIVSHDSDQDLAFMVSDFLENWSGGSDSRYSSDSDSGCSDITHIADKISFFKHDMDQHESELLSVIQSLILSINEADLNYVKAKACNASCVRQKLVKLLRLSGIDAALCFSKWQRSDKVPGGEHEYIDVVLEGNTSSSGRLIIDIDFRSNFEIARAVESYDTILRSLPVVYVGYQTKLKQYLQVMVEAARSSLKQNSMPLPPWRSLAYLQAKWHSTYDRKTEFDGWSSSQCDTVGYHEQCIGHLKKLKSALQSTEKDRLLKPIVNDDVNNQRSKFNRRRIMYR